MMYQEIVQVLNYRLSAYRINESLVMLKVEDVGNENNLLEYRVTLRSTTGQDICYDWESVSNMWAKDTFAKVTKVIRDNTSLIWQEV